MAELTPQAIVDHLDEYLIGQTAAKRAVALALIQRQRRRRLDPDMAREVSPHNLLLIGPTGVGKTEIARRVAGLVGAPFLKVEATKFTEVGYVGRDVDSIIADLVEMTVMNMHDERLKEMEPRAQNLAAERLVDYIYRQRQRRLAVSTRARTQSQSAPTPRRRPSAERQRIATLLESKELEDQLIEIEVFAEPPYDDDRDYYEDGPDAETPRRWRRVPVREARRILTHQEAEKLIDFDEVVDLALQRVEQDGVVFIDEFDKLAGPKVEWGRDVSGEGVQRDLLPLLEGSTVMTRYGPVKTDHILYIGAGTFHQAKPASLMPEIQGRFPLRVELRPLAEADLARILVEPRGALTKQYQALLKTEDIELEFADDAIAEIAHLAALMNERVEDIGARRLHTIVEKVLEEISFSAAAHRGERVVIDRDYVRGRLAEVVTDQDLSRYIL